MVENMGWIVVMAIAIGLAGCSQTPGDAEIREALKSQTLGMFGKMNQKEDQSLNADLAKIKVIGCKKAESNVGFNCDWTGGEPFGSNKGRIVKSDSGWILAGFGS